MRIAYMPDTHFGGYDQQIPTRLEVAAAGDQLLREAEVAEEVGFEGLWLPERHARPETYFPSILTVAAAMAARTTRIQIATAVLQPTYYHPVHVAEQLAQIDSLSKGRLVFGAGVGYHEDYFRLFGVSPKRKNARFEEVMQIIEGVWTNERFSFHGEFYKYDDILLTPKPYRQPRPPVWIGAFFDNGVERATDWDGWIWGHQPEMETARERIEYWREKADKKGRKNWSVGLIVEGWIGDDDKQVREQHGHRWVRELAFYQEHGMEPTAEAVTVEKLEQQFLILGSAQKWIDRLGEMREQLKPDWVCLRTRTPVPEVGYYPDPEESLECIYRLGEEVIRHFQ
ncbi:MAG: alkanesulfonate monooxygenase SsuD [Gammaproteobacteria bacterium]|jgi:alkanesulfonate monooxygenase SsuD/methylene tetrahydromethanopterin reductase-like flavin-dependent oxidoreductase (luciferase family)